LYGSSRCAGGKVYFTLTHLKRCTPSF
jgi:hypothetical protein